MRVKNWSDFKALIDQGIRFKYFDRDDHYTLFAVDGDFKMHGYLEKTDPKNADQIDFEDNYQSQGNSILQPLDPDTKMPSISTRKLPANWYPEFREIEFTTSKENSIHDKNYLDEDISAHTIKFYDEFDAELTTQAGIDTSCVKTVISFDPSRVWAIRGAYTRQVAVPNAPVYVWMNFKIDMNHLVPGLVVRNPYANGGLNMEFQNAYESVGDEGENYSFFTANDGIEWIIRHDAGLKHRIRVIYQLGFSV